MLLFWDVFVISGVRNPVMEMFCECRNVRFFVQYERRLEVIIYEPFFEVSKVEDLYKIYHLPLNSGGD